MRFLVGGAAVTICLFVALAHAQLPPSGGGADAPDPRLDRSATTNIPVTMPGDSETMDAEKAGVSTSAPAVALEEPIDPKKYICGSGDTFELNFWGQQNFRLKVSADLEGRLFISKVGFVDVAGKTLAAVRSDVSKRVRGNYPGLRFELTLVAPRSFLVHVAANVAKAGAYSANPLERVSAVLTRAGGMTAAGSHRRIEVRHRNGTSDTADLVLYEITGDTKYNPYVLDGDVIYVPFVSVEATVSGAVRRPGTYELVKTKDLAELFELAGGFSSSVVRSLPIRVVHRNKAQQETALDLPFKGDVAPNRPLEDDDRVIVSGSDQVQRTVQLLGAVVGADPLDNATTSKRLPFIEGDTVMSLIDRAGGIKAPGDLRRAYISRPKVNAAAEVIPVDLDALLVRRDFHADKAVQMGDTIVVPPMQYSIRVEGAVGRPGLYPYNPNFGIAEYIAHAGGRTRSARDLDETRLIDGNGKSRDYSSALKLSPGDAILVPERNFTRPEIVQIALSAAGLLLSGVAITIAVTR